MAYDSAEARQSLLDEVATAIEALGRGFAHLGAAYELLDERLGDRLEEELYGPAQRAYGTLRRVHAGFAERVGIPAATFATPEVTTGPREGAGVVVGHAVESLAHADALLAELQDTMLPVEVGDPELRAGLADVRTQLTPLPGRAREVLRVLGR
jgi:hypothetical protein